MKTDFYILHILVKILLVNYKNLIVTPNGVIIELVGNGFTTPEISTSCKTVFVKFIPDTS